MDTLLIIGVDPGSRRTGYGLIAVHGRRMSHVDSGTLHCGDGPMPARLLLIMQGLRRMLDLHHPHESAIEQVFLSRNVDSALKLGQARGSALVALAEANIPIHEYAARQVKQAVVGSGAADKSQIQFMVQRLLNLNHSLQADAADALAIAICHAQYRSNPLLKVSGGLP